MTSEDLALMTLKFRKDNATEELTRLLERSQALVTCVGQRIAEFDAQIVDETLDLSPLTRCMNDVENFIRNANFSSMGYTLAELGSAKAHLYALKD